jgi:hypothetical protein
MVRRLQQDDRRSFACGSNGGAKTTGRGSKDDHICLRGGLGVEGESKEKETEARHGDTLGLECSHLDMI